MVVPLVMSIVSITTRQSSLLPALGSMGTHSRDSSRVIVIDENDKGGIGDGEDARIGGEV